MPVADGLQGCVSWLSMLSTCPRGMRGPRLLSLPQQRRTAVAQKPTAREPPSLPTCWQRGWACAQTAGSRRATHRPALLGRLDVLFRPGSDLGQQETEDINSPFAYFSDC